MKNVIFLITNSEVIRSLSSWNLVFSLLCFRKPALIALFLELRSMTSSLNHVATPWMDSFLRYWHCLVFLDTRDFEIYMFSFLLIKFKTVNLQITSGFMPLNDWQWFPLVHAVIVKSVTIYLCLSRLTSHLVVLSGVNELCFIYFRMLIAYVTK